MSSCVVAGGAPETRHCSHLGCSESNERSGDQRAAAFGMSLLFLPSASFAGSFLSLSLSLRLSIEAVEVRRGRPQSLPSLSFSLWSPNCCVTTGQTFRSLSLGYLRPFTLTLHGERWRRQVATLLSTHAALRNTDVAPISPLSLSHVHRDHHHRRRRVGLTRPTLNPRLNTKRPLARSLALQTLGPASVAVSVAAVGGNWEGEGGWSAPDFPAGSARSEPT